MARDIDLQQLHRSLTGTVQIPPYVPAMERSAYPTATDEIARLIDRCAELASEVTALQKLASDALKAWDADKDARVGKLLRAMVDAEFRSEYRPDLRPTTQSVSRAAPGFEGAHFGCEDDCAPD